MFRHIIRRLTQHAAHLPRQARPAVAVAVPGVASGDFTSTSKLPWLWTRGFTVNVVPKLPGVTVSQDKYGVTVYAGPKVDVKSLPSFFNQAQQHLYNPCIASDDRQFTYYDLLKDAANLSKELRKAIDPASFGADGKLVQERVAYLIQPSYEYVVATWAIWGAGAVAVPLFPNHPLNEMEYILNDSGANAILVSDGVLEQKIRPLAEQLGKQVIVVKPYTPSPPANANTQFTTLRQPMPDPVTWSDALFIYTSGTTGKPKGVRISHGALLAQVNALHTSWGWTSADRIRNVLPLHHVHGVVNVASCALWSGAKVEFLPTNSPGFDAKKEWQRWLDGAEGKAEPLSLFMAVPTIYSHLIREYDSASPEMQSRMRNATKTFRLMVSGSMALPLPTLERWREISGQILLERYGMTEIGMALSNPLDEQGRRPGTVGSPLPGVEVALRSLDTEEGESAKDRAQQEGLEDVGELLVRGPTVFKMYWNKPEATATSFVPPTFLTASSSSAPSFEASKPVNEIEGSWFCTGDTAGVDKDGYFRILGRTSVDVLKVSGFKISALDVEREYLSHPAIAEVAVIGMPSPQYGQTVCMIVVPKDKSRIGSDGTHPDLSLDKIREWGAQRMAAYKVPRSLWIVEEIPRNAMGKINKKFLASKYPIELLPK